MKIRTILDQIDLGSMALPEFQRGYVWNRDQVRGLMQSLYRKHPVGSLLVWETRTENARASGDGPLAAGTVKLLLDGQQRITSLYGLIRGRPPRFFDGNAQAFAGLYFHLDDEAFEFYSPLKMKDDPLWIGVTELMQGGVGPFALSMIVNRIPVGPGDAGDRCPTEQTSITELTYILLIVSSDSLQSVPRLVILEASRAMGAPPHRRRSRAPSPPSATTSRTTTRP